MKKLSMLMAALALVATGCDPYDDAPGGDLAIITVTAAGRTTAGGAIPGISGTGTDGQWTIEGVPVGPSGNNVIVVTTNRLLDGTTIQAAAQDPTNADDTGDCKPAGDWLQITKAVGGAAAVDELLTYDDPTTTAVDPWQWYTCYYAASATSEYGASLQIFRAKTKPGFTAATSPMRIARLEPATTYTFTAPAGTVKDDAGNDLTFTITVKSEVTTPVVTATPTAANSVTVIWDRFVLAGEETPATGVTYTLERAKGVVDDNDTPADTTDDAWEPGEFAEVTDVPDPGAAETFTYVDVSMTDADAVPYFYRVTSEMTTGSPAVTSPATTEPVLPELSVAPTEDAEEEPIQGTLTVEFTLENALSYKIERADEVTGTVTWTEVGAGTLTPGLPTDITLDQTGLADNEDYFYRVTVTNAFGEDTTASTGGRTIRAPAP
jgi:hypothetical protein